MIRWATSRGRLIRIPLSLGSWCVIWWFRRGLHLLSPDSSRFDDIRLLAIWYVVCRVISSRYLSKLDEVVHVIRKHSKWIDLTHLPIYATLRCYNWRKYQKLYANVSTHYLSKMNDNLILKHICVYLTINNNFLGVNRLSLWRADITAMVETISVTRKNIWCQYWW